MGWRRGIVLAACGMLVLTGCTDDGDGEDVGNATSAGEGGPAGTGEASGADETDGQTAGATSTSGASQSGGTGSGATQTGAADDPSGSDPCFDVYPSHGQRCDTPGAECSYGDDCGSWDYVCEDGIWVTVGASTCGAVPIACEDGPADGDPCWGQEVCDPDGDCRDVLQCESGTWTLREICSDEYCAGAEQGGACDEIDRTCPYPCGPDTPVFRCTVEGWDGTNLAC